MSRRSFALWCASGALLAIVVGQRVQAQYAPPPDTYSVTQINSMFGAPITVEVHRDGSKALVDSSHGAVPGTKAAHLRTLYFLDTHENITWDLLDSSVPCGKGTWEGDWGDPFALSAEMNGDLSKQHPAPAGEETLNGIATKVFTATDGDVATKAWVEKKYGLIVRLTMTTTSGGTSTVIDTKQFDLAKPAASVFELPATCAAAAKAPPVPTEAEQIAAETSGNAQDYAQAIMPPASKNSCSIEFKVVHAGSLQPIAEGFQVAIDTTVDVDHPASYVMGLSNTGRTTFSGGGLHEVTGQMRNGALVIRNIPGVLDMEVTFGKGGASSALIYRQCFTPQTTLLLVVKNPDKLSDGARWLWVKSGK